MPNLAQIHPPLAGIQRSTGFQEQADYSCYESINYWPVDVFDGHQASATRPPLTPFTSPGVGVNMLAQLNLPEPTPFAAVGGVLQKFDGTDWNAILSDEGITTGRQVFAAPYIKKLFIANDGVPLYYDDDTDQLLPYVATEGRGTVPLDCRIICQYAGCIVFAGDPEAPHIMYFSRVTDPFDFDYEAPEDDQGGAFVGTSSAFGILNEPITALIPLQGRLLIGTENSIFLLTGHPRQGGQLECLSRKIGILGNGAWSFLPSTSDELYFLSKTGVHAMQTESLRRDLVATPLSKKVLPDELIGLDFTYLDPTVCMSYESRWGGIVVCDRAASLSFWIDAKSGGFFRQVFDYYPTVLHEFDSLLTSDASGLLFGGTGYGGLARFDRTGSEPFASSQIIGPVKLSQTPMRKSIFTKVMVNLGGGTNDLAATISFITAPTAQSAVNRALSNSVNYRYDVTVGTLLNNGRTCIPHLGGHAVVMQLRGSGVAGKRVVFEGADMDLEAAGQTHDLGLLPPVITGPLSLLTLPTDPTP